MKSENGRQTKRTTSLVLTVALALSSTLVGTFTLSTPGASAADADPEYTLTHPWDSNPNSTGNYIADSYKDVLAENVFENVTTDRLLDILSSNGNYYIYFGGPEHASSKALLPVINTAANAAADITKIYHFDPYVDGYQLDSTLKKVGAVDVTGGTSVNFGVTAKISDVWKLITNLLPATTIATGGVLEDYAGDTALLLNVNITDRKNVEAGKTVAKIVELKAADSAAFVANTANVKTAASTALTTAFTGKTSSVRSQFDFFSRLYNASAAFTEGTSATQTANRYGLAFPGVFFETDRADFRLKSIDVKELYNLLNAPGEVPILFAGQGCHNTQAIIGAVARKAREYNTSVVYVVDFALDSNVKFGTGDNIDTALGNSATGGLWIRSGTPTATTPFRYGYSYLYGKIAEYLGPNWVTENSSKKNNYVSYFKNAELGSDLTVSPSTANPTPASPSATRLQVPTLIRYNKSAADPVVGTWLHEDNFYDELPNTYTEYMLELAWVNATQAAIEATGRTSGRDQLTVVEFAAEAVVALENVLKANTSVTHQFTTAPVPEITGDALIGSELEAFPGEWSHNVSASVTYQWYSDGVAIAGATSDIYTTSAADAGKQITVSVTATRAGYEPATKTSKPTDPIGVFESAPIPVINGTTNVGDSLGLNTGVWTPTATFSYQWNADGVAIAGATNSTYQLQGADIGKKITVSVTGSATGRAATARTSAPTAAVSALVFTSAPDPVVSGNAIVGETLGLNTGNWAPWPAGAAFSFQWNADNVAISGATTNQYKIVSGDIGKRITVTVTVSAPNFVTTSKTSTAIAVVKASGTVKASAFKKAPKPKISGTAKVGKTLKVKTGSWSPKPKFSYQWFAGGKAIKKATKASLKLKAAQKGKKITVKVTAKKNAHKTTTKVSKATAKVK